MGKREGDGIREVSDDAGTEWSLEIDTRSAAMMLPEVFELLLYVAGICCLESIRALVERDQARLRLWVRGDLVDVDAFNETIHEHLPVTWDVLVELDRD